MVVSQRRRTADGQSKLRGLAACLGLVGIALAERDVDALHHAIDGVDGLGDHALDVPDEKARIVGRDQLTPKRQVLREPLTQRAG